MTSSARVTALLLVIPFCYGCSQGPDEEVSSIPEHALVRFDSIGAQMGDSNYVFGMPRALEITSRGNIVVGDIVRMKMMMYSPEGVFIRSGGNRGEGPGEYSAPTGISATPDGGILVSDAMGGKLIIYDSLLDYGSELMGFTPYPPEDPVMLDDGSIIGSRAVFDRESGTLTRTLARWASGEVEPSLIYLRREGEFDQTYPGRVYRETSIVFCTLPGGRVAASPLSTEEYTVTCYDPDGGTEWVLEPEYRVRDRQEEDIEIEREMMRAAIRRNGGDPDLADRMPIEERACAVTALYFDGQHIWARRGGELEPLFDVLSTEGEYLYSCRVPSLPYGSGVAFAISPYSSTVLAYLANPQDYSRIWMLRDRDFAAEGEVSPVSPGLTSCTLSVHDDLEPFLVSLYWVGPPETPDGFRMAHTVSMSPIGSDSVTTFQGLEAYYHGSSDVNGYLVAEDMNFDGYADLRLMESPSAGPNTCWYYWLFHPETGTFLRADIWEETGLVSPSFDPGEGVITSFHRDGGGFYGTEYYRVEDNVPVLVRSETTEYISPDSAVTTVMELIDGEMKVIGTSTEAIER
ncbi:MAG: hypothetical protein JXA64_05900 [Candidatus Fermentibacteraceae bacterium]|nr:hypothetical protein [Candidatus Fermentibacteraceae bacterium]MBN2608629.1 hypothetical protein [Candidatus Fermentibacteraceae bacterium]